METPRSKRKRTKLVHEGNYVAEVEAVEFSAGYSDYTTERDTLFADLTLDRVLEAVKSKPDSERV